MKNPWLSALLLAPALAAAQTAPADPSNPALAVPPVAYRSVFADTPRGVETGTADWPQANAEVGQFRRGHIDLLKWEEQRAVGAQGAPKAPVAPHHSGHGSKP